MAQPPVDDFQVDLDLGNQASSKIDLTDLRDVSAPSPNDGEVLTWDNDQSRWEAQPPPDASGANAGDVGTYMFGSYGSNSASFGDLATGIRPTNAQGDTGPVQPGTWMCMGVSTGAPSSSIEAGATLWLRVA